MKINFSILLLLSFSLLSFNGIAQSGKVKGKTFQVIEGKEEVVPLVNILDINSGTGTSSNFDGEFELSLTTGKHQLRMSAVGYYTDTIELIINANEILTFDLEMVDQSLSFAEFKVVAKKNTKSITQDIQDVKESDNVENKVGEQKLSEVGASDAKDGVKKIVGLSIVGSKYLYVRGLGDRYNFAYLNGLPIPSPDPDRRVIPLDIFPTAIISSISVKKAFMPDLYGGFAGGAVNIITKEFVDKPTLDITINGGYNSQSTFKNNVTYKGGKLDYLGFDDGTRALPSNLKSIYNNNQVYESIEGNGTGFKTGFQPQKSQFPLNSGFKVTGGNFFSYSKDSLKKMDSGIGVLVSLSHSYSTGYKNGSLKIINAQDETRLDYDVETFEQNTLSSGLANLFFKINPKNKISYNFLFANISEDAVNQTWGYHFDYSDSLASRRMAFKRSDVMMNQLLGDHTFLKHDRLSINWGAGYATTESIEPDRRQLTYQYNEGGRNNTDEYGFQSIDLLDNHRFFSWLNETDITAKFEAKIVALYNVKKAKEEWEEDEYTEKLSLTAGYNFRNKNHNFDYRQYVYEIKAFDDSLGNTVDFYNPEEHLNEENHDIGLYQVKDRTGAGSAYEAQQIIHAGYLMANLKLNRFQMIVGARVEKSYQHILYTENTGSKNKKILDSLFILPSLMMRYDINEKNVLRLTASQTVSRPYFREIAPFQYTEVYAGEKKVGNPNLKNGIVTNTDLRYEWYPNIGEMLSVGGYFKYIQNPIEAVNQATASGRLTTFQNADAAYVAGIEIEFVKNLSSFLKENKRDSSILRHFSVGINAAYLYSRIKLDTTQGSFIATNTERQLQGASPLLINFDLSYNQRINDKVRLNASLAYNFFGSRLYKAGVQGIGDQYEKPIHTLNAVFGIELFNRLKIGITGKNLINPIISIIQESATGGDDFVVNEYKRGLRIGLSIKYRIFR